MILTKQFRTDRANQHINEFSFIRFLPLVILEYKLWFLLNLKGKQLKKLIQHK